MKLSHCIWGFFYCIKELVQKNSSFLCKVLSQLSLISYVTIVTKFLGNFHGGQTLNLPCGIVFCGIALKIGTHLHIIFIWVALILLISLESQKLPRKMPYLALKNFRISSQASKIDKST